MWCHRENGGIPYKYPLDKVHMGLIIKGTVPKKPKHFLRNVAPSAQVKVLSTVFPPALIFPMSGVIRSAYMIPVRTPKIRCPRHL